MLNGSPSRHFSLSQWLHYHFLEKKLNTGFGWAFLGLLGLVMAFGVILVNYMIGPVVVVCIAAMLLLIILMKFPYTGFYFLIAYSSVTATIDRFFTLPIGSRILDEIFVYLLFLSVILKYDLKKNMDRRFWTNPVSIGFFILYGYYLIELFNPDMLGILGWFSFFKRQLSYFIFYYICYCLLDSRKRIIHCVRFMVVLSSILALYACKQQWFGYAGFELKSIGTGYGLQLLFQGGLLRKFSVFSDPATSGILFACIFMLCLILFIRTNNKKEKFWLGAASIINLLGYSYSGTRTATLMILAGTALYCVSTLYEKRTARFLVYFAAAFTFLFFLPYYKSSTLNRIRSTFAGNHDASAALRNYNRHQVQPYIQNHPIGGGIFTCGIEGPKYNEGHYLEFLQPDSGYMKTLAEQGAIGLVLLLIFYFIIMRHGFYHFFRVKDPEIRNYYIALLVMMFTLIVAQYAQMAILQSPVVLFFHAIMVIFIKLADFDEPAQSPFVTNYSKLVV